MEYDENPSHTRLHNYPCEDPKYPTFYKVLQEAGYHTMMAGKDHLTGGTGVGLAGELNARCLGWTDQIRTNDKFQNTRYDLPRDPYGIFLAQHVLEDGQGGQRDAFSVTRDCYGYWGSGECVGHIHMKSFPHLAIDKLMFNPGVYSPKLDIGQEFYVDDWVRNVSETLFNRRPTGKPWFLQVGFPGPHPPFIITERMNASVAGRTYPAPVHDEEISEDMQQFMRRSYAAEIENIDRLVGEILGYIKQAGELDNTIVVYLSDHGDELGDYSLLGKTNPWDGSARVPFIVSGPGLKKGQVVNDPTLTLDAVGMFMEAARATPRPGMNALSLLATLREGSRVGPPREYVRSGLSYPLEGRDWRTVVKRFNTTSVLKFVCCLGHSCPDSPWAIAQRLPPGEVQLSEVGDSPERQNLLPRGMAEAVALAGHLPEAYREPCARLLRNGHYHPTAHPKDPRTLLRLQQERFSTEKSDSAELLV